MKNYFHLLVSKVIHLILLGTFKNSHSEHIDDSLSDDSVDTEDLEDKSPWTNFGIYFLLLNIYFHNPSEGSQPSVMGTGSKDPSVEPNDGKLGSTAKKSTSLFFQIQIVSNQ